MISDMLAVIATITGIIVSFSAFIQAWKIYVRKSSADLSIIFLSIVEFSIIVWWLYGISILNYPIMIANGIGIIAHTTIIILWFKYRGDGK